MNANTLAGARPLSLAHLTVLDAHPLALIEAGAAGGYDAVGLRIVPPMAGDTIVPVVGDRPLQRAIKARLADTGLRLLDVEAIWLSPQTDVGALRPALDLGAELGAGHVLVVGNDPDLGRTAANFAALCAAAHDRRLRVMLEFIPYSQVRSLAEAYGLLAKSVPTDAGILVDALHLSRSGGCPADLAAYDPALFTYLHLCDAPARPAADLQTEGRTGRCYPGEGQLWLADLLAAMPDAIPIAIEAPVGTEAARSPGERACRAADACRRLLGRDRRLPDPEPASARQGLEE